MTQMSTRERTVAESPVDDATYNLMQALTSKLEAIEAYEKYRDIVNPMIVDWFERHLVSAEVFAFERPDDTGVIRLNRPQ